MSSITFFIISVVALAVASVLIYVKSPATYFKTDEGKGVAAGIGLAVALSIGAVLLFPNKVSALEYLKEVEVYVGLDRTSKISPMCTAGPNSDRLTSNLGIKVSLLSSDDERAAVNLKYTHHSCAFNPDYHSYDAPGIEVVYKFKR